MTGQWLHFLPFSRLSCLGGRVGRLIFFIIILTIARWGGGGRLQLKLELKKDGAFTYTARRGAAQRRRHHLVQRFQGSLEFEFKPF